MTRPIKLVHDCATGVTEEIELTDAEIEANEAAAAAYLEQKAEEEKAAADKLAARQAVYLKLGLTSDEVEALFN